MRKSAILPACRQAGLTLAYHSSSGFASARSANLHKQERYTPSFAKATAGRRYRSEIAYIMATRIGLDLGTANSSVFIPKKGIILTEPSVVAVDLVSNKVIAVGKDAKEMIGKTPKEIKIFRPLREGVIADYKITRAVLKYFFDKARGGFDLMRPSVVISAPAGVSSAEKRALSDAAIEAGCKDVYIVKEPILAALGAGIPINAANGNMVVNVGGGTCETAVISLGGIVTWESLKVAGDKFDLAIQDYLKRKYSVAIGDQTAERIKIEIGSALVKKGKEDKEERSDVVGLDLLSGLPRTVTLTSNEIAEAINRELNDIIGSIKRVLAQTPPELVADIMEKGMVLSGGGALLRDFDRLIEKSTKVPVFVAEDPLYCVARGTGIILEKLDLYRQAINIK